MLAEIRGFAGRGRGTPRDRACAVGLLTHVSMFLLGAGLLVLADGAHDREAWRWRMALAAVLGWAVLWVLRVPGAVRCRSLELDPPTSPSVILDTFGGLAVPQPTLHLAALSRSLRVRSCSGRSDRRLGRAFAAVSSYPRCRSALHRPDGTGHARPTFTLLSWGPCLALGYLVADLSRRSRLLGPLAIGVGRS